MRFLIAPALVACLVFTAPGEAIACGNTFCGSGEDDPNAIYPLVVFAGCTRCHMGTPVLSGLVANPYTLHAFNVALLEEWLRSSYYKPGKSKLHASIERTLNKTMPPGLNGTDAYPENVFTLYEKLDALRACLESDSEGGGFGDTSIWGTATTVVNGEVLCSYYESLINYSDAP